VLLLEKRVFYFYSNESCLFSVLVGRTPTDWTRCSACPPKQRSMPPQPSAIARCGTSKVASKTVGLGEENGTNLEFLFISWRIHHKYANRHQAVRSKVVWLCPAAEHCPMSGFERKSQIYSRSFKQHTSKLPAGDKCRGICHRGDLLYSDRDCPPTIDDRVKRLDLRPSQNFLD
jgi:hypothetical protein